MAELGLNVFQVIQNELISREGSRSNLGLGFRLAGLEERMMNAEAISRNGRIWRLTHAVSPLTAITPESRERMERQRKQLLERRGAKKKIDEKDPTMHTRCEERWEVDGAFPRTILEFKQLQHQPKRVRRLLDFYNVRVYRPDFRLININPNDACRDVAANMESCLEELAIQWGIDWQRIGGMAIPLSLQSEPPRYTSSPSLIASEFHTTYSSSDQYSPPPVPQQGVLRRSTVSQRAPSPL